MLLPEFFLSVGPICINNLPKTLCNLQPSEVAISLHTQLSFDQRNNSTKIKRYQVAATLASGCGRVGRFLAAMQIINTQDDS
jgi:hypothetical protein